MRWQLGKMMGAGVTLSMGTLLLLRMRKSEAPEEQERRRGEELVRYGRTADGTVLDLGDPDGDVATAETTGTPRFIFYKYEIGGATYESAQDLHVLSPELTIPQHCVGGHALVKYDPRNHANSIVVAKSWSGLPGLQVFAASQ